MSYKDGKDSSLPGDQGRAGFMASDGKGFVKGEEFHEPFLTMSAKRQATQRARVERNYKKMAWRLGVTPHLLKAVLKSKSYLLT